MNKDYRYLEEIHHKHTAELIDLIRTKQDLPTFSLIQSSEEEDTKQSFDFKYGTRKISHRIRKLGDFHYGEFTLRSRSKGGGDTELDKVKYGYGDLYFYGWADNEIRAFIFVDLNKLRPHLEEADTKNQPNGDGTEFYGYSFETLRKYNALVAKSYNITI